MISRVLLLAVVLGWIALAVLGSVDIGATARLFAALGTPAGWLTQHV